MLDLLQEVDHVAALAAGAEAVPVAAGGGDLEAGRLLVVEGAEALHGAAGAAQRDVGADDLLDPRPVPDGGHVLLVDPPGHGGSVCARPDATPSLGCVTVNERNVPWLVFDGDCSFCTSSATWVAERLHRAGGPNAALRPWQFTDLAALGTTAERAQQEVLWVDPDGEIRGGAAAFAGWLRFRGGAYAVAGRAMDLPGVRSLAARRLPADRPQPPPDARRDPGLRAAAAGLRPREARDRDARAGRRPASRWRSARSGCTGWSR